MARRLVSAGVCAALMVGGCGGNSSNPTQQKSIAEVPAADRAGARGAGASGPGVEAGAGVNGENGAGAFHPSQLPRTPEGLASAATAYAQVVQQVAARPMGDMKQEPAVEEKAPARVEAVQEYHAPVMPELSVLKWLETSTFDLSFGPAQEGHGRGEGTELGGESAARPAAVISIAGPATQPVAALHIEAPLPVGSGPLGAMNGGADAATEELEKTLAQRVRENPKDLAAHLDYQLFQFVRGKSVPQIDSVGTLDAEDREVLSAVLDAMSNFRSTVKGGGNLLMAKKVQPLVEMQERLVGRNLRVTNLALCRKVDGFGIYDKLTVDRIDPMRSQPVIVYCEVENFSSRFLTEPKVWETTLSEEISVYDSTGKRVWIDRRQSTRDTCRTRRRDFSLAKMVRLPAMAPGRYTMTVSVQDEQAQRLAEMSLPFVVATEEQAAVVGPGGR